MGRKTITVEEEVDVQKTVTETTEIEVDEEHCYCDSCGSTIGLIEETDPNRVAINPSLNYDTLIETLTNITMLRLRRNVHNEDIFMEGGHFADVEDADDSYTYSESDIIEELTAAISLNANYGINSTHRNSLEFESDDESELCENCATNEYGIGNTDSQTKEITSENKPEYHVLRGGGIVYAGIAVLSQGLGLGPIVISVISILMIVFLALGYIGPKYNWHEKIQNKATSD